MVSEKIERKIAFDLRDAMTPSRNRFHGGLEYADGLISALLGKRQISSRIIIMVPDDGGKSLEKYKTLAKDVCKVFVCDYGMEDKFFAKFHITLYFNPLGYGVRKYNLKNIKLIVTIHGIRYAELPYDINLLYFQGWFSWVKRLVFRQVAKRKVLKQIGQIVKSADGVICSCYHTKYALIKAYSLWNESDKLHVHYCVPKNGESSSNDENGYLAQIGVERKKYFMAVSMGVWTKNPYRLSMAVKNLKREFRKRKMRFIFVGVPEHKKKIFDEDDVVVCLDYIVTEELETLYKNAYAFVYPTLNEGFGYPPLEVMKYGVPVTAAMVSSLPETCGRGVLGFNPYNVDEITNRIYSLMCEDELYQRYSEYACEHSLWMKERQLDDLNRLCTYLHRMLDASGSVDFDYDG